MISRQILRRKTFMRSSRGTVNLASAWSALSASTPSIGDRRAGACDRDGREADVLLDVRVDVVGPLSRAVVAGVVPSDQAEL